MATKLMVYEIEDAATGKIYEIEGPEGVSEEELFSAIQSYSPPAASPSNQPQAPVASPEAAGPSGVQPPSPNQTVYVQGRSSAQPFSFTPEGQAQMRAAAADPNIPFAEYEALARRLVEEGGSVFTGAGTEAQLQAYRKALAEGAPEADVPVTDFLDTLPVPEVPEDQGDGFFDQFKRGYQDAVQYGTPGFIARTYHDWVGTGMDELRKAFPDATPEQLEYIQEAVINRTQKNLRAGNAQATENDSWAPWLAGQFLGSAGLEDFVPFGQFAGQGARGVAKRAGVAGGINAGADVGYQLGDIAADVQDEYNYAQTALAPVIGAGFQAGVEGAAALARTLGRSKAKAPSEPRGDISLPTARRGTKAYTKQLAKTADELMASMDGTIGRWENAPEFLVHKDFKKLPFENDALGVMDQDGKVHLHIENILAEAEDLGVDPRDVVSSVAFHEALGHYGLAQEFGDNLDYILSEMVRNPTQTVQRKMDEWLERNPDGYADDPNRDIRIAEEVLADMSNNGEIPKTLLNTLINKIKEFARRMNIDLKYSERELRAIMSMAHSAVVNGKGRDVASNGYRTNLPITGRHPLGREEQLYNLQTGEPGPVVQTYTDAEARQIIAERTGVQDLDDVRYMKRSTRDDNRGPERVRLNSENVTKSTPSVAAKTFLKELGVFNNYELSRMGADEAIDRAARLGVDYEWLDYYNHAEWDPDTKEVRTPFPQPDMSKYLPSIPKYMKRRTRDEIEKQAIRNANEILTEALEGYEPTFRSWDEAKRARRARGLTPSEMKKLKGIGDIDRRLYEYDNVAQSVNNRLLNLLERRDRGEYVKGEILELVATNNQIMAKIFDDQAEVGRALNVIKDLTYTRKKVSDLNEILSEMTDTNFGAFASDDVFNEYADRLRYLLATQNTAGVQNMLRSVMKPYWWQYLLSFRHAMMLSGVATHAKNTYDNATMITREWTETALSVPAYMVSGGKIGASPQELAARTYGLIRASLDGKTYRDTFAAFKEGHPARMVNSKVEMQDAHVPGFSKIQDFLHAQDVFFRAFHDNANLYALGVRKARKQGFKGMAMFEEGSNYAANPTKEMLNEMRAMSDVALLVDSPSGVASWAEPLKAIRPGMKPMEQVKAFVANMMFPFFRVTDRLIFQKLRRSPLAFLDKVTREDLAAGGERAGIAMSRIAYGSAQMYFYWWLAGQGADALGILGENEEKRLFGEGPDDFNKRAALEAGGWKPNSVLEDGKFVDASAVNLSIMPWDFQNAMATNIATIREAYESGKADDESTAKALGFAALTLMQNLAGESFVQSLEPISELLGATEGNWETKAANVAGSYASQWLPAAMRQYNQMVDDPVRRDTSGDGSFGDRVTGRLKSAIPGMSDDLPERYDNYGDVQMQGRTALGMDNFQVDKNDPVSRELSTLERETKSTVIRGAPSTFQFEGDTVRLNADAKQEWNRVQGYYLRLGMESVIPTDEWKSATKEERVEIAKEIRDEAYDLTKAYMLPILGLAEAE